MIKGTTKSGFEYVIDEKIADDMEFVDLLAEATENPLYMGKVIERLLGKEQKKKLYDFFREEDGRVPVEAAGEALIEILSEGGEDTKN